jgi:hypothetical protein
MFSIVVNLLYHYPFFMQVVNKGVQGASHYNCEVRRNSRYLTAGSGWRLHIPELFPRPAPPGNA